MTLKEILITLSEEKFINRNAWGTNEKSVISGKKILGFPSDRVSIPVHRNGIMYDIVNIGDNTYEFYVGNDKETNGSPYKHKDCYIGTYKFDDFSDNIGVALGLIKHFINSNKINPEEREYLRNFYNKEIKHPYYKGHFEEL